MNVLMQLRKVCNHPDLFEARTIESPFIMTDVINFSVPQIIFRNLSFLEVDRNPLEQVDLANLHLVITKFEHMSQLESESLRRLLPERSLVQPIIEHANLAPHQISRALVTYRPGVEGQAIAP